MQGRKDYYAMLGLGPGVGEAEIKKAFRQLALKWHPDKNHGDPKAEVRFKLLLEAYQVLSDQVSRQHYDREHAHFTRKPQPQKPQQPPRQPEPRTRKASTDPSAPVDEIFASMSEKTFTQHQKGPAPRKGEDLRYPITIEFKESIFGVEKVISYPVKKMCNMCKGSGARKDSPLKPCSACYGSGLKRNPAGGDRWCETCEGLGVVALEECMACKGEGSLRIRNRLKVVAPPGAETGQRLRIPGEGQPGYHGGPPGDLYVVVTVKDHPLFTRQGFDVVCDLPLTFCQAAMGVDLNVPTIDGPVPLKIKAGTQHGEVLSVKGRGVPTGKNGDRGDQKFVVSIEVPKHLSPMQRQLLRQFDQISQARAESSVIQFWQKVRNIFE